MNVDVKIRVNAQEFSVPGSQFVVLFEMRSGSGFQLNGKVSVLQDPGYGGRIEMVVVCPPLQSRN